MTFAPKHRFINTQVDMKKGLISREIFVSEEVYQREQEQIFARTWLFVGHESQIPNAGDYFVSCMGEEPVILTRDVEDKVHVFLNTCRHRGMKVCRYDEGNTTVFTCSYHGWSYATDGKLVGVPYYKEAYHERLDRSQWGLVEVAQLENYKGTIWATWDKSAPPFLEYLGGMKLYLDLLLNCRDGREGGSELIGGIQKWRISCNWKFAAENFVGDSYHDFSHRSVDKVGIGPSGRGRRDIDNASFRRIAVSFPDLGHGTDTQLRLEYTPSYQNTPQVEEYFKYVYEERQKRLGKMAGLVGGASTVFPNTSFSPWQPRTIAVWHPRGPLKTEAWRFFLVDKDAPQEVKDVLRHYYMRYSGPGGMTEQDDMENWSYASAASKGTIARRYSYNYQMGMGFENPNGLVPGLTSNLPTEQNQRGFYKRWAEFMDAESWDQLYAKRVPRNSKKRRQGGGIVRQ